jgi:hypothetical protein
LSEHRSDDETRTAFRGAIFPTPVRNKSPI